MSDSEEVFEPEDYPVMDDVPHIDESDISKEEKEAILEAYRNNNRLFMLEDTKFEIDLIEKVKFANRSHLMIQFMGKDSEDGIIIEGVPDNSILVVFITKYNSLRDSWEESSIYHVTEEDLPKTSEKQMQ